MKMTKTCPMCRKEVTKYLNITNEQMSAYVGGMLVQNAFPHLSVEDREFIITGYCDSYQKIIFAPPSKETEEKWQKIIMQ